MKKAALGKLNVSTNAASQAFKRTQRKRFDKNLRKLEDLDVENFPNFFLTNMGSKEGGQAYGERYIVYKSKLCRLV
jgi:hypothetical protein